MAKDRVFDAELVVAPEVALLQQGYLWTVANLIRIPKGEIRSLTWEVPDVEAHLSFTITPDADVEGALAFVNSFSGGVIITPFNRNSIFAPTATPPKTIFREEIIIEDATPFTATGLFPGGTRSSMPSFIVSNLHQCLVLTNDSNKDARVWPLVIWHEQPVQDIPAGDPGP